MAGDNKTYLKLKGSALKGALPFLLENQMIFNFCQYLKKR